MVPRPQRDESVPLVLEQELAANTFGIVNDEDRMKRNIIPMKMFILFNLDTLWFTFLLNLVRFPPSKMVYWLRL
jgi:hypothetical protein